VQTFSRNRIHRPRRGPRDERLWPAIPTAATSTSPTPTSIQLSHPAHDILASRSAAERGGGDRLRSERCEYRAQTTREVATAVPVEGPVPSDNNCRSRAIPRALTGWGICSRSLTSSIRASAEAMLARCMGTRPVCVARVSFASRTARCSARAMACLSGTEVSRAACAASALPAGAGTPTASARSNRAARSRAVMRARTDGRA